MTNASKLLQSWQPAKPSGMAKTVGDAWKLLHSEEVQAGRDKEAAQTAGLAYMPTAVSKSDLFFASSGGALIPDPADVAASPPSDEWKAWASEWIEVGAKWLPEAREGVDLNLALHHLAVIVRDVSLPKSVRVKNVAWLGRLWFTRFDASPIQK